MAEPKILLVLPDEAVIYYKGWRFTATIPLEKEYDWKNLKLRAEDDRPTPEGRSREQLPPLPELFKDDYRVVKKRAFGIIEPVRERELERRRQAFLQPALPGL